MGINKGLALLFLSTVSLTCFSQKVKYKDLFVLLNAKQYDQAEPFLKKYLKENDDNPNAHLFMAIIHQEKSVKADVLKQTEILAQQADSAVLFYGLAVKGITEKELKKNDEYYQMYNRRDLRTGEFGVKLSDVQFDIEKRVQALKERKERVQKLKEQFAQAELLYSKAAANYKALISSYRGEKEFFLRADEKQSKALHELINVFDSCVVAFNSYKSTSQLIGKTGYSQLLNLLEVKEFGKDGLTPADFMANDVRVWDYKRWAEHVNEIVAREIIPMREHLTSYDVEINKLREKLRKDSVSVKSDLTHIVDKLLSAQLRKYDPNPLPIQVFNMKIAELEYASEVVQNKPYRDSINAQLRLINVQREWDAVRNLDSLSTQLFARDINEEAENYSSFVKNAYGTTLVLKSLISATKEFAERERNKKKIELAKREEAFKWLVVATDSVPAVLPPARETKFKPLVVVNEEYTAGLTYADSVATGYFYSITPTRVPDVKINFPVDKASFMKRNLPVSKGLSASDGKGQIFFVGFYSESKQSDKFPMTVARINRSNGLAWSNNLLTEGLPNEMLFDNESGELSIKISTGSGENKILTFDKNGKLIQ